MDLVQSGEIEEVDYGKLEDLDLFTYREFDIKRNNQTVKTNILIEIMENGMEDLIEYAFSEDSFINVRSLIRKVNRYEFQIENPQIRLDFIIANWENEESFEILYDNIIHLLSVTNFQQILKVKKEETLVTRLLREDTYRSMFISSLEG